MKAVVFTLGCKVNSCESSSLINGLVQLGFEVSENLEYADVYIINTCAVTLEAEKKSRQAVSRVRKFNKNAKIFITGCASENNPQSFASKDGVVVVTGTRKKDKILSLLNGNGIFIEKEDVFDELLPPITTKSRAFVKIQDGCNNFCSYCIIPYLRGRSRSRSIESIVNEIKLLSPSEVVLTAINLSAYDYNGKKLVDLIKALKDFDCRIRLGSLEDNIITEEFLQATLLLKNFAPHFHLSLQSGSDNVLKKMNRHYTRNDFIKSVELIRKYYKNAGITTDIIVGFPTETEEDFLQTIDLCNIVKFSDIHCFNYSSRTGTVASKLKELSCDIKKDRLNRLIELKNKLKNEFILDNIDKSYEVILEDIEGEYITGYTENYIKAYLPKGEYNNKKIKVKLVMPYNDGVICKVDYE